MAENTKIEWATHSFNPWRGCTKVSDGCKHCYAEALVTGRFQLPVWGPTAERRRTSVSVWRQPLKWNRAAAGAEERPRVFCASLADVFEGPETCQNPAAYAVITQARADLWELIEATPNLDWLLLTKRPENILKMVPESWWQHFPRREFPRHVWVGTSVENQQTAEERIWHLTHVPAAVHFLSIGPLLGPVEFLDFYCCKSCGKDLGFSPEIDEGELDKVERAAFDRYCRDGCSGCGARHGYWAVAHPLDDIQWIIAGGESGPKARPMHPEWVRRIRDACEYWDIPFLFKQWGEHVETQERPKPGNGVIAVHNCTPPCRERYSPTEEQSGWSFMRKVGKHAAGRILDGREWNEFPAVAAPTTTEQNGIQAG